MVRAATEILIVGTNDNTVHAACNPTVQLYGYSTSHSVATAIGLIVVASIRRLGVTLCAGQVSDKIH